MPCSWFMEAKHSFLCFTGISSYLGAKLRDWAVWHCAVWPVQAGCYSLAALSSNHSKTRYYLHEYEIQDDAPGLVGAVLTIRRKITKFGQAFCSPFGHKR